MPQASDEQRAFWGTDDGPPMAYLKAAGYNLTRQWEWELPAPDHTPTKGELSAIEFLADEWDMGWFTEESRAHIRAQQFAVPKTTIVRLSTTDHAELWQSVIDGSEPVEALPTPPTPPASQPEEPE